MTVHLPHSRGRPFQSSITFRWLLCKNLSQLSAPSKSCASDPLPSSIVKQCVDELSPAIINLSLESDDFPEEWKGALVEPTIKKPKLELIKKNFRPVSN